MIECLDAGNGLIDIDRANREGMQTTNDNQRTIEPGPIEEVSRVFLIL